MNTDTIEPILELPIRLSWRIKFSEIVFDEPPYLVMQSIPEFPGCNPKMEELGIVWNIFSLIESAKHPGAHQLLTCECGYAPDAYLEEAVLVSHPDADTIIWELDIRGLGPVLDPCCLPDKDGFVRLLFRRVDYEADIRIMLGEMSHNACTLHAVNRLTNVYGLKHLREGYPEMSLIKVDELEPVVQGDIDRLLALTPGIDLKPKPLWTANSVVEFGFFKSKTGHALMRVNGKDVMDWPGRYFTRWRVLAAFKKWLKYTQRAHCLKTDFPALADTDANEFVLFQEADRRLCHEAGKHLANEYQASLQEGETATGVSVHYVESALQAAKT